MMGYTWTDGTQGILLQSDTRASVRCSIPRIKYFSEFPMSIEFVHAENTEAGIPDLLNALVTDLRAGKQTLWLICGGSNIAVATSAIRALQNIVTPDELGFLTIMQTDERFGPVGHPDSNWTQMHDQHFPFDSIRAFPILIDTSLEETVERYGVVAEEEFARAGSIIALFGIGADSHIAGILPHSSATTSEAPVAGYVGEPYTRISLTFPMLRRIHQAFVFAFGEDKKRAMLSLRDLPLTPTEAPAHILREIPKVKVYSNSY